MKKRLLTIVIAMCLALSLFAVAASAAGEEAKYVSNGEETAGTLAEALISADDGSVITLLSNAKLNSQITLTDRVLTLHGEDFEVGIAGIILMGDSALTLGGEDYEGSLTVKQVSWSTLLTLQDNAVLNMYDGVTLGPSMVMAAPAGVALYDDSVFNMYGGVITDCDNPVSVCGGVAVSGDSTFNMYGGLIENCDGVSGGAVMLNAHDEIGPGVYGHPTFNMSGGAIRNCTDSYGGGGAICATAGQDRVSAFTLNITGGEITGCSSAGSSYYAGYGGAIIARSPSTESVVSISNLTLSGNSAGRYGGGIFLSSAGKNALTDVTFDGNSAGQYGGGICVNSGSADFSGCTFTDNSAEVGGGLCILSGGLSLGGANAYNNDASSYGDDIYFQGNGELVFAEPVANTLEPCGHTIDGWYLDGSSRRWSEDAPTEKLSAAEPLSGIYSLKAAHGKANYAMSVSPGEIDFGSAETGYEPSEAQTVTVTNTGNRPLTVTLPSAEGYVVAPGAGWDASGTINLAPGASADFTVQPESGLGAGTHNAVLTVTGNAGGTIVEAATALSFIVTAKQITPVLPDPEPVREFIPKWLNTDDHFAYMNGYPDGGIRPDANISRAEAAAIIFRLLDGGALAAALDSVSSYSDVSAESWYGVPVATLENLGAFTGYPDGTFRPDESMSRAEFAALLTRFFDYEAEYAGAFGDVSAESWYADYVQAAHDIGLIEGYGGEFRPAAPVTRAEAAAIVNRALGRVPHAEHLLPEGDMRLWSDNPASAWYYAHIQEATNGHDYKWVLHGGTLVESWREAR